MIAVGKTADIVLFDLKEIKGFEDYFDPTKAPVGIKFVLFLYYIQCKSINFSFCDAIYILIAKEPTKFLLALFAIFKVLSVYFKLS